MSTYDCTEYRNSAGDHLHLRRAGGPWWYWRVVTTAQEVRTGGPSRGKFAAIVEATNALGLSEYDCDWTPDEVEG